MDKVIMRRQADVKTIINNATFNQTVTGADIDLSSYDKVGIYVTAGTKTTTPTMDVKLQVKDPNSGHYFDHTALAQITAAGDYKAEISSIAAKTGRIVCTYGGTGNYAACYVAAALKS